MPFNHVRPAAKRLGGKISVAYAGENRAAHSIGNLDKDGGQPKLPQLR